MQGDDIKIEETEEVLDESAMQEKIKSLRKELKAKEQEVKANLDGWQRARAELVNKEKQLQQEKLEIYKSAAVNLLEEIIPVLDSYEMAKKNREAWDKVDSNWRVGVEYIFQQLITVCENSGLKKIDCKIGDVFDVNKMSAVEEVSTDDSSQDHTISDIIQSGYELNGKILREVKVKIFIKK
jgi:molecular chaperone GrpE